MNLYDFAEDVFTKIGKIIKNIIQPHLRILLYLEKVINNETPTALDLNKLSLENSRMDVFSSFSTP